jgi:hypothetical protein
MTGREERISIVKIFKVKEEKLLISMEMLSSGYRKDVISSKVKSSTQSRIIIRPSEQTKNSSH